MHMTAWCNRRAVGYPPADREKDRLRGKTNSLIFSKKADFQKEIFAGLNDKPCSGRTDRAWISEHPLPHATAEKEVVQRDSSSSEGMRREGKSEEAKNCQTHGRSNLGAR
jgi:hypothetical protein